MRQLVWIFRWMNVLVILATFLSYLAPWVNPEKTDFFTFFGTGYSWLLVLNILFVLFWAMLKKWNFLLSLLTILVGWAHFSSFIGFNFSNSSNQVETVKIMSYNTDGLRSLVKRNKGAQERIRSQFFNWLGSEENPDILCTQESGWTDLIKNNTELKYKVRNQGVTLFSKYPFLNQGSINFKNTRGNAAIWADVKIKETILRIYSVHFLSNKITKETEELIENADLQQKQTWRGLRSIIGKYQRSASIRVQQAQEVLQHIQESPYPVVLCGDFNETPVSYLYKTLNENLKDNFKEAGGGIGTTFNGDIPGLKLDYILTSKELKIAQHKILKDVDYSDHYPIFSIIELK